MHVPLTPYSPIGQDCTAIPGVADLPVGLANVGSSAACQDTYYVLSRVSTHCISTHVHNSQPDVTAPEDNEFMQAIHYGLEHHPLQRN